MALSWLDAVTNPLSAATKTLQELMEVRDLVKFGDTFRKLNSEIFPPKAAHLAATSASWRCWRKNALLKQKWLALKNGKLRSNDMTLRQSDLVLMLIC